MKKKFTFRYFYGMYFVDRSTRCRLTLKFFLFENSRLKKFNSHGWITI